MFHTTPGTPIHQTGIIRSSRLKCTTTKLLSTARDNENRVWNIDEMTSFTGLNELSDLIGGPNFDSESGSIDIAKNILWEFVSNTAEDDIDLMCMGQLTGRLMDLGGGDSFEEGTTIEEARGIIRDLVTQRTSQPFPESSGGCSCCRECEVINLILISNS